MSRIALALALGGGFVVGCVAATTVEAVHAETPAAPGVPAGARRWEQYCSYRRIAIGGTDELVAKVNDDLKQRGAEGWELVSSNFMQGSGMPATWAYCFKRPLP